MTLSYNNSVNRLILSSIAPYDGEHRIDPKTLRLLDTELIIPVQNGHFSLCGLFVPACAATSGNDALSSPPDVAAQAGTKILTQRKMHFTLESLIAIPYGNEVREPKQKFRDIFKKWVFMEDGRAVYAVAFGGEAQKKQVITARIRAAFLREPPSVSLYANEPDRSGRLPEESDSPNSFSHSGQIPYRLNHQGTCPL